MKGDVASRTESQKLNYFSNFKSVVCKLCGISLKVIKNVMHMLQNRESSSVILEIPNHEKALQSQLIIFILSGGQ